MAFDGFHETCVFLAWRRAQAARERGPAACGQPAGQEIGAARYASHGLAGDGEGLSAEISVDPFMSAQFAPDGLVLATAVARDEIARSCGAQRYYVRLLSGARLRQRRLDVLRLGIVQDVACHPA